MVEPQRMYPLNDPLLQFEAPPAYGRVDKWHHMVFRNLNAFLFGIVEPHPWWSVAGFSLKLFLRSNIFKKLANTITTSPNYSPSLLEEVVFSQSTLVPAQFHNGFSGVLRLIPAILQPQLFNDGHLSRVCSVFSILYADVSLKTMVFYVLGLGVGEIVFPYILENVWLQELKSSLKFMSVAYFALALLGFLKDEFPAVLGSNNTWDTY
eukprot:m.19113 g.19113  ORF g.19113 m.19113 type:complete len:208 (-) comp5067_c0_seq1:342-965(-)